jgi:hypothetical protein
MVMAKIYTKSMASIKRTIATAAVRAAIIRLRLALNTAKIVSQKNAPGA